MRLDQWLVLGGGIALIALTYWFFLSKADRSKNEEHRH